MHEITPPATQMSVYADPLPNNIPLKQEENLLATHKKPDIKNPPPEKHP
jgi:hypothetical protein